MGERNHRAEVVSFAVGFNGANFTIKEGSNRFGYSLHYLVNYHSQNESNNNNDYTFNHMFTISI